MIKYPGYAPSVEAPWKFTQEEFNKTCDENRGHLTMAIIESYFEFGYYIVVDSDGNKIPLIDAVLLYKGVTT